ncbi:MAG: hypothetical protein H0X29_10345 [Parachlamydiaceae bacterium]|nr:hypothetical protein [Parachlamydiaceae bacterium]
MLFYLILLIATPFCIFAQESGCYLNIERNFFNESVVNQALASRNISQSNWTLINQSLRAKTREIPAMVRERAKKLNPNPFDTPFRPIVAGEILKQVQFEVFVATLALFKITNLNDIQDMFIIIRKSHRANLKECFGEEI